MIQLPLWEPESHWTPRPLPDPSSVPNLIALDTETNDPGLEENGPGYVRNEGHLAGVSVYWPGFCTYWPIGHLLGNLDRGIVLSWLKKVLSNPERTVYLMNGQYDRGWLRWAGVEIKGKIIDVQIMDSLIDEERPDGYSLNAIAKRWISRIKDETLLNQAAKDYGLDPKKDLWKLPPKFIGPYAEMDAEITYLCAEAMWKEIDHQRLRKPLDLEISLLPILSDMHWNGIRVDLPKANRLADEWSKQLKVGRERFGADIWNNESIAEKMLRAGIHEFPRTAKGNPSFTKDFLETAEDSLGIYRELRRLRTLDRLTNIYLIQNICNGHLNGRVHSRYIQIASDDGGTRTRRLASADPNIQQIPKRSKVVDAKAIRKIYLPEEGEMWAKKDYNSQEPRMQVHYALLCRVGGEATIKVKEFMESGGKMYSWITDAVPGISYDDSKMLVLARSYSATAGGICGKLGRSEMETEDILHLFDEKCPFIGQMAEEVNAKAERTGMIRTILGGIRHFNLWVPRWVPNVDRRSLMPLSLEEAKKKWPDQTLVRAGTRKGYNGLIQGSCAEQTKKAIVDIKVARNRPPLMSVHDEISDSVKTEEEARLTQTIMEQSVPLLIRSKADLDLGPHWQ